MYFYTFLSIYDWQLVSSVTEWPTSTFLSSYQTLYLMVIVLFCLHVHDYCNSIIAHFSACFLCWIYLNNSFSSNTYSIFSNHSYHYLEITFLSALEELSTYLLFGAHFSSNFFMCPNIHINIYSTCRYIYLCHTYAYLIIIFPCFHELDNYVEVFFLWSDAFPDTNLYLFVCVCVNHTVNEIVLMTSFRCAVKLVCIINR